MSTKKRPTVFLTIIMLLGLLLSYAALSAQEPEQPEVLAPFYTKAEYPPPEVGSYSLPPFGVAADGVVLDTTGNKQQLHDYLGNGKMVLLSFIYSTCSDVNGCPLATAVMYNIQQKIKDDPQLRDRFQMLSLSFDPVYDTPEVMALYGGGYVKDDNWRFLTTASWGDLKPILDSYNQSVIRDVDEKGNELSTYSHILRVFLIDPEKRIRNIYSVAFLYPELIINDAKTILLDSAAKAAQQADGSLLKVATLSKPGDYKEGYETGAYETRSQSVTGRTGKQADLSIYLSQPPLGLPAIPQPANNPVTKNKVELGRKLFFDRRLSLNDTFSCAMCHIPEQGFTSNELAMAVGLEGRSGRRNSPTVYNSAYLTKLFHDGREESLEQQVWGPLLAANEMANPSVGAVVSKVRMIPEYKGLFEAAFDGRGVSMETLGMAIASYERLLVSGNSAFDRWHYGKEQAAMSEPAKRGYDLFIGKAGCVSCHIIGEKFALFTDDAMHNTGLGYRESMGIKPKTEKILVAPGVYLEVDREIIDGVGHPAPADVGLYEVTQNPHDRWKYHTPSLRNVALTAPYMHNGSLSTLRDVIDFYNDGGVENELLDPLIRPLGLTEHERDDLVAFMQSLTGDNVDTIIADAFAAPVGDITEADPNWANEKVMNE
ncbi:MAG: SCO family protein [Sedimenticola sp.]|nr:SCO family protein [Sedimenticola sp.]